LKLLLYSRLPGSVKPKMPARAQTEAPGRQCRAALSTSRDAGVSGLLCDVDSPLFDWASTGIREPGEDVSLETFHHVMQVNLTSALVLSQAFCRHRHKSYWSR
jgi:hypothetical protein